MDDTELDKPEIRLTLNAEEFIGAIKKTVAGSKE